MIERTINEAGNAELARRDASYVRVPTGEVDGETLVFTHSISGVQWRWPNGVATDAPNGWPIPYNGEVPDYVDEATP